MSADRAGALTMRAQIQSPFTFADFDPRVLKKGFRKVGAEVRKIAKKEVSKKAVSRAGDFPGRDTGTLRKSIKAKVSRSGFSVGVASYKVTGMDVYYPAFVYWGHRAPGEDMKDGKSDKKQHGKKRVGTKVAAPRKNYIAAAAEAYGQTQYQSVMSTLLDDALKDGVVF